MIKFLSAVLLLCCIPLFAADNNPRVVKLRGFKGLWLSPTPPWSPTNMPNLFGWWKADSIVGGVNGDAIPHWFDSSGHNLDMAMEDPPYYTNNFINGKPAVYFDGVNNFLTNACAMNQTNCMFFVIRHMIPPGVGQMYLFETADTDDIGGFGAAQYFRWEAGIYTNGVAYAGAGMTVTNSLTNTVTSYIVQFADDLSRVWTNGVPAMDVQGAGKLIMNGMKVGASAVPDKFFKGHILEMGNITNAFVTSGTTLQDLSNYLRAKYGHY